MSVVLVSVMSVVSVVLVSVMSVVSVVLVSVMSVVSVVSMASAMAAMADVELGVSLASAVCGRHATFLGWQSVFLT